MSLVSSILLEPAKEMLKQIGYFLTQLVLVLLILLVGWMVAKVVKAIVVGVLKRLDLFWERIRLEAILEKGGIKYSFAELVGVISYWLTLFVALFLAMNAIGWVVAAELLERIVLYIPNAILGIFILVLGMFVATFLKNIVKTAASNAGLVQAELFSKIVEIVVIAFAIFITLEQLKIGIRITELTLAIVLGSIGLALALAFGLGCKDIVAKIVQDFLEKIKK